MNKKRKIEFRHMIIIAVLTCVLTALFTFLLTIIQLRTEQKYWEKRLITERLLELQNRQITTLEDINSSILELEILAKEMKILTAEFNINMAMLKRGVDDYRENKKLFENKLVDYHKKLYSFSSKLQIASLYFEIDSLIMPLSNSLEANYKNNMIVGEDVDLNNINSYFDKDYETIQELTDCRLIIIEKMLKDIKKVSESIFKE